MLIFVFTEIMFFTGLVSAFLITRASIGPGGWPPPNQPRLPVATTAVNTVALLLSAAYLSIGMCVSAATDNQLVAFAGTALLCAAAYALGETGSDLGRALGTGARFDSVARGVLDLRDLAY